MVGRRRARGVGAVLAVIAGLSPAVGVAAPPALPDAPAPEDAAPVPLAVTRVLLRSDGVDAASVRDHLLLRAPSLDVVLAADGDVVDQPPPFAHVVVHPSAGATDRWELALFLSNGAAYFRGFEASDAEAARVTATMVIGLLHGPALAQLGPATPAPPAVTRAPIEPRPAVEPPAPAPRVELGIAIAGGLLTGFGAPRDVDGLAAGTIAALVVARLRRGATVGLELRAAPRARLDYVLGRFGVLPHAGYTWRLGHAEIQLTAFASIERWILRRDGAAASLDTLAADASGSPWVLGGGARLAPGYRLDRGRLHARVGLFTALSGAAMARGGAARISVPDADGLPIAGFRVGGFEWAVGFDVMVWIPSRAERRNAAGSSRTDDRHDTSKSSMGGRRRPRDRRVHEPVG